MRQAKISTTQLIGAREQQEDYFATYSLDHGELIVLADGMGGEAGGEIASHAVVKAALQTMQSCNDEPPICFKQALNQTQTALGLLIDQDNKLKEMGATLIIVYVQSDTIRWLSVGDSLIYRIRDGKIERINANHSIGGELDQQVKAGLISEEEAQNHPHRHFLTSVVSRYPIAHYEIKTLSMEPDDLYIVASDGIQTLSETEILQIGTAEGTLQEKSLRLQNAIESYQQIRQDNTTIILLQTNDQ